MTELARTEFDGIDGRFVQPGQGYCPTFRVPDNETRKVHSVEIVIRDTVADDENVVVLLFPKGFFYYTKL